MERKLEGKNVVLTGANGGMGKAMMPLFLENGANIIACIPYEDEETSRYFADLQKKYDPKITTICFDMTDSMAIKEGIKQIKELKVPINILINNAGIPHLALVPMTKLEDLQRVFQINYFAQFQVVQGLFSLIMRAHGVVINMASAAGIDGEMGNAVYGATKASMILLTKVLSKEMARGGVRVNAVAPGLTNTPLADQMGDSAKESMIATSQFHRLGKPEEIANAVLFLASDDASFINGQVLRVDGGM